MTITPAEVSKSNTPSVDELRGLREQRAGDAGDRRRDRVDDQQPPVHRRADRVHARHVLADAGERLAERRIDDARAPPGTARTARRGVEIGGVAEEVEANTPNSGANVEALQAVVAAGEILVQPLPSSCSMMAVDRVSISSVSPR